MIKKNLFFTLSKNSFLPGSYTKYKQSLGLSDDDNTLFRSDRNTISLIWPHKDCVLQGGQDKKDAKRNEIFYNQILSRDEIDRLLEPKVLASFKLIDKDGEKSCPDNGFVKRDGIPQKNFLIQGNNLLTLHCLQEVYRKKIKLIYIDPPYNTGNDTFTYNDNFTHSTWLTFMKNRLKIARELLRDDGVIFISIDDNEQAYLKVLCDEIFGRENFVANLIWANKEGGGGGDSKFFKIKHEYIIVYCKRKETVVISGVPIEDKDRYKYQDKHQRKRGNYQLIKLDSASIQQSESLVYAIDSPDKAKILPNGCWRWSKEKVQWGIENDFVVIKKNRDDEWSVYTKQYLKVDNADKPFDRDKRQIGVIDKFSTTQSNRIMKELFGEVVFPYSKPYQLIQHLLKISTEKNDIILDFFAGSGTTGQAVLELNREDGGNRRFILVEQLAEHIEVCRERLQKVLAKLDSTDNQNQNQDFISFELAKYNQKFAEDIRDAKTTDALLTIYDSMQKNGFLSYQFKEKEFQQMLKDFKSLAIAEQKKILMEMLDHNMLYINLNDIDDKKYAESGIDKKNTRAFYQDKIAEN